MRLRSEQKSKLPRVPREFYRGGSYVFWTHTFEQRATGWLTERFHFRFREVLLHANARYGLACPVYTLMPDHWHLMWIGLLPTSDQLLATAFLRKNLAAFVRPAVFQDRAHDHVLRSNQRAEKEFMAVCDYVLRNPVRANLAETWQSWPYPGSMIAGYAELDPRDPDFWPDFWKIHRRLAERDLRVPALPGRATSLPE